MSMRQSISLLLLLVMLASPAYARDAAFVDPGTGGSGAGDEAVKVDPKSEIDVGDTVLNVSKRTSVFFVNQTNLPVKIEKITVNNDSNVTAETTSNDCMKQGSIAPMSRCSVEISTTPTSPGSWSVDVLMTHNGAGRISRARLTGKTSGSTSGENKSTGLAVNTKDTKPIDFGDVIVGDGKIVRTTLMINDSPDPITLYSIDAIEADNGLQRLDQGCAVDMELPPGASCPVTLLWVPTMAGPISTDLIIRHSGKLGFAVIPIRGVAKGGDAVDAMSGAKLSADGKGSNGKKDSVPPPPSAQDLVKAMTGTIPPVSSMSLGGGGIKQATGDGRLHLIGTIGDRALLLRPDGDTMVASVGDTVEDGEKNAKIVAVGTRSTDILVDGKKKTLMLEEAASLVAKATQENMPKTAIGGSSAISPITGGPIK